MSFAGQYGRSFASKLIEDGHYEQAIEAATKALALEQDNPEHFVDRATALAQLGRDGEAAADFVRALELDQAVQVIETDLIDDAYFSALLAAARADAAHSVETGCARLAGYLAVLPDGRHVEDVDSWTRRLRGELKSEFVKVREA
jgi:tetratricopeptide (TPR) repeat protein